jgi:hypothetical protein
LEIISLTNQELQEKEKRTRERKAKGKGKQEENKREEGEGSRPVLLNNPGASRLTRRVTHIHTPLSGFGIKPYDLTQDVLSV